MASGKPAPGEDSLIARYFRPLATDPGAFGLDDDAAALRPEGSDIVVTTDAIVEGVHFLPDDPPDTVARKALRVNLSDLAAKGATPAGFVLTLALRSPDEAWLKPFAAALGEDAAQFACPLLGGDTVSTPGPLMISITAFGRVPPGEMVRRSRAEPGDRVVVSGTIGDAALGLAVLGGRVAVDDPAAREALIEDAHGHILEGAASNVFAVFSGKLVTPPESAAILPGITRGHVLELARAAGIKVELRAIAKAELAAAQEVFVCSSIRELVPVVSIDGQPVGNGMPGVTTRGLLRSYRERAAAAR